jgi:hypothetical protein
MDDVFEYRILLVGSRPTPPTEAPKLELSESPLLVLCRRLSLSHTLRSMMLVVYTTHYCSSAKESISYYYLITHLR